MKLGTLIVPIQNNYKVYWIEIIRTSRWLTRYVILSNSLTIHLRESYPQIKVTQKRKVNKISESLSTSCFGITQEHYVVALISCWFVTKNKQLRFKCCLCNFIGVYTHHLTNIQSYSTGGYGVNALCGIQLSVGSCLDYDRDAVEPDTWEWIMRKAPLVRGIGWHCARAHLRDAGLDLAFIYAIFKKI